MSRKRIDRDLMHMASPRDVAVATMTTIDALQDFQPHVQVLGAAAVFLNLATHFRVPAQDVFTAVANLMNDRQGMARPEFAGVRQYMENELA